MSETIGADEGSVRSGDFRSRNEQQIGFYRAEVFLSQKWRRPGRPVSARPVMPGVLAAGTALVLLATALVAMLLFSTPLTARFRASGTSIDLELSHDDAGKLNLAADATLELRQGTGSMPCLVNIVRTRTDRCVSGLPCLRVSGTLARECPHLADDGLVRVLGSRPPGD